MLLLFQNEDLCLISHSALCLCSSALALAGLALFVLVLACLACVADSVYALCIRIARSFLLLAAFSSLARVLARPLRAARSAVAARASLLASRLFLSLSPIYLYEYANTRTYAHISLSYTYPATSHQEPGAPCPGPGHP
jgi:hypothetical protein